MLEAGLKLGKLSRENVVHRNLRRKELCAEGKIEKVGGWRHAALPQESYQKKSHADLPLAHGTLHIADPDVIDDGNLNRCIWFGNSDVGFNKAERITRLAQSAFSELKLIAHPCELKQVPHNPQEAWLKRLVIGVDSRRARRNLQTEIPGEVYDASTTNIEEVVLHFNRQPLEQLACLSCIYPHYSGESAHEQHVADTLGVSLEDVKKLYVSLEAAQKICNQYPHLQPNMLQGLAYDSLFKQMCGTGTLKAAEDKQVFAPFSFVSVLAGTYLAIEFLRRVRLKNPISNFNLWKLSPWQVPVRQLRRTRPRNNTCDFCSNEILVQIANQLWARN